MLTAWTHVASHYNVLLCPLSLVQQYSHGNLAYTKKKESVNVSLIRYKSRSKGKSDKYTHKAINYIVTWLYLLRITKAIALFLRPSPQAYFPLLYFLNYLFESFHYDQFSHHLCIIGPSETNQLVHVLLMIAIVSMLGIDELTRIKQKLYLNRINYVQYLQSSLLKLKWNFGIFAVKPTEANP